METLNPLQPDFELTYNGKNITANIAPYVLSISYTDYVSGQSDELDVELEDCDGRWLDTWYPEKGAVLQLKLGYAGQNLITAGRFEIDEVNLSGPPSIVKIRALATGVQTAVRTRSSAAFENTTLAAIAQKIAAKHKMTLVGKIERVAIKRVTQYQETDLAFLTRIAKDYGYAFKVTDNDTRLVFWKEADLHQGRVIRSFGMSDLIHWSVVDRVSDVPKKVTVTHHKADSKELVVYGVDSAGKTVVKNKTTDQAHNADTLKINKRADAQTAQTMAEAELQRRHLARCTADIELPGAANLAAGSMVELLYFGRASGKYFVQEAKHRITRYQGFITSLHLARTLAIDKTSQAAKPKEKDKPLVVYGVDSDGKTVVKK